MVNGAWDAEFADYLSGRTRDEREELARFVNEQRAKIHRDQLNTAALLGQSAPKAPEEFTLCYDSRDDDREDSAA